MTTERRVPDVLLERFLADDLGVDLRRHIEAERDARPEVRAQLDELASDRQSFLAADPPAEFARRLAGRLQIEQSAAAAVVAAPARSRRWLTWVLLGPSAAAAVALLVTFTVTRMSSDETASAVLLDPASTAAPAPVTQPANNVSVPSAGSGVHVAESPVEHRRRPRKIGARKKAKKERTKPVVVKAPDAPTPKPTPPKSPPPETRPEPEPEPAADVRAAMDEAVPRAVGSAGKSSRGGLSDEQIKVALVSNVGALEHCLKSSDDVSAGRHTLDLAWRITPRGRVKDAEWKGPASLRGTALARCVLDEMRTWRFPGADPRTLVRRSIKVTVE